MKWLADENFRGTFTRGVLRRSPRFDLVRVQEVPQISGQADTVLLDWASRNDCVVLTHDVSTMIPAMREQLCTSRCAPIVFVPDSLLCRSGSRRMACVAAQPLAFLISSTSAGTTWNRSPTMP